MNDNDLIVIFKEALDSVAPGRLQDFDVLTLDASIDDLSLDSVNFMELIGVVEERIGRTFADDQLARISTLRDIANLIRA